MLSVSVVALTIGIPAAALGYLSPALAGAAMAMSSVSVVSNSLLLRRWRPALRDAVKAASVHDNS